MPGKSKDKEYNLRGEPVIKDPAKLLVWYHAIQARRNVLLSELNGEKQKLKREYVRISMDMEDLGDDENLNSKDKMARKKELQDMLSVNMGKTREIESKIAVIVFQLREELEKDSEYDELRKKSPPIFESFIRGDFNEEQVQFVAKNMLKPVLEGKKSKDEVILEGCKMSEKKYNLPQNYWKPWLKAEGIESKHKK